MKREVVAHDFVNKQEAEESQGPNGALSDYCDPPIQGRRRSPPCPCPKVRQGSTLLSPSPAVQLSQSASQPVHRGGREGGTKIVPFPPTPFPPARAEARIRRGLKYS